MAIRSVYIPDAAAAISGDRVEVSGDEHRHLVVARADSGERVEVFDGRGRVWPGVVVRTEKSRTRIEVGPVREIPPPEVGIVVAQALVKHSAFDWILEKVVELGATRIVPLRAERSNDPGTGRSRRWRRILIAATKQSKQYHIPDLAPVASLEDVVRIEGASRIVFSETGGGPLKPALAGSPAVCLVGPEGGWAPRERDLIADAGFSPVHFGGRVLRAETAAVVGVGLIAYELGVL